MQPISTTHCLDCLKAMANPALTQFGTNVPECPFLEGQLLDIIAFYDTHVSYPQGTNTLSSPSLTFCQPTSRFPLFHEFTTPSSPTAYLFGKGHPNCPFTEGQTINDIKDFETQHDSSLLLPEISYYSTRSQLHFLTEQNQIKNKPVLVANTTFREDTSYASYDDLASFRCQHLRHWLARMADIPPQVL